MTVQRLFSSVVLAALLGAGPLMTACAKKSSDADYEARVKDNLKSAQLEEVRADWKDDEKALHLSGDVRSAADKARAEELAQQVVGTSGRVVNEVKVEGTTGEAMDDRIEKDLDRMFKDDNQWDLDAYDLTFDSKAGLVTITGSAPSEALKNRVTERAKTVEGVTEVVNNMEIKPAKGGARSSKTPRLK
jgi:osmotically-inducible protein OsmY